MPRKAVTRQLEHLCTRPEMQKLLILISDGQPADHGYCGTEAEADLRGVKKEYEKRDVILFAAAIGDDKENIRRIYKDGFLDITKLEDLYCTHPNHGLSGTNCYPCGN